MVTSESLKILELGLPPLDYGALAHLDLPNLKVLVVVCIPTGQPDLVQAVSEFVGSASRRSLVVLRMVRMNVYGLRNAARSKWLKTVPIMEIDIANLPRSQMNMYRPILFECFDEWVAVESRLRKSFRYHSRRIPWSVGWVDSSTLKQCQESLPSHIVDAIDVGLLV